MSYIDERVHESLEEKVVALYDEVYAEALEDRRVAEYRAEPFVNWKA